MPGNHQAGWQRAIDAPDEQAYALLARDRVWNCFAIADLAPPFRAYSQIAVASQDEADLYAACLVVRHPSLTVLSPFGASEGVAALLAQLALPAQALIQAQTIHRPLLERYYQLQPGEQTLLRMAVSAHTFRPPVTASRAFIERLLPADLEAVSALYGLAATTHFRPDLLEHGLFYGIRDGERLLAAGGTHVLTREYGIAVLGNIFTHPDARRQGYARAITAALISSLLEQGCRDVVLNVLADNTAAIDLYTNLGFQTHCAFWSSQASLRARADLLSL